MLILRFFTVCTLLFGFFLLLPVSLGSVWCCVFGCLFGLLIVVWASLAFWFDSLWGGDFDGGLMNFGLCGFIGLGLRLTCLLWWVFWVVGFGASLWY